MLSRIVIKGIFGKLAKMKFRKKFNLIWFKSYSYILKMSRSNSIAWIRNCTTNHMIIFNFGVSFYVSITNWQKQNHSKAFIELCRLHLVTLDKNYTKNWNLTHRKRIPTLQRNKHLCSTYQAWFAAKSEDLIRNNELATC